MQAKQRHLLVASKISFQIFTRLLKVLQGPILSHCLQRCAVLVAVPGQSSWRKGNLSLSCFPVIFGSQTVVNGSAGQICRKRIPSRQTPWCASCLGKGGPAGVQPSFSGPAVNSVCCCSKGHTDCHSQGRGNAGDIECGLCLREKTQTYRRHRHREDIEGKAASLLSPLPPHNLVLQRARSSEMLCSPPAPFSSLRRHALLFISDTTNLKQNLSSPTASHPQMPLPIEEVLVSHVSLRTGSEVMASVFLS